MERTEILKQMTDKFMESLGMESLVLTENTTADDVKEWDSLTHIQVVVAIEKHFNILFSSYEIQSWKNVGEMLESIEQKLS